MIWFLKWLNIVFQVISAPQIIDMFRPNFYISASKSVALSRLFTFYFFRIGVEPTDLFFMYYRRYCVSINRKHLSTDPLKVSGCQTNMWLCFSDCPNMRLMDGANNEQHLFTPTVLLGKRERCNFD